jgi:hypothetical protein
MTILRGMSGFGRVTTRFRAWKQLSKMVEKEKNVTNETAQPGHKGLAPSSHAEVMPPVSPEERRNRYNLLVRTAKLTTLLLHETNFVVQPDAHAISRHLLSRDLEGRREVLSHGCEDGDCVVRVKWIATMRYRKRNLIRGSASYIVSYRGMKGFSEDIVEEFADVIAKAATYPYFRALYAHLDWSAELGSPPLPLFQFHPKV